MKNPPSQPVFIPAAPGFSLLSLCEVEDMPTILDAQPIIAWRIGADGDVEPVVLDEYDERACLIRYPDGQIVDPYSASLDGEEAAIQYLREAMARAALYREKARARRSAALASATAEKEQPCPR